MAITWMTEQGSHERAQHYLATLHPQPSARDPPPATLHLQPCTCNPPPRHAARWIRARSRASPTFPPLPRVAQVCLWAGLLDVLLHLRPALLAPPHDAPRWMVNTLCGFLIGGALLNAFWMVKIVRVATRRGPRRRLDESPNATTHFSPVGRDPELGRVLEVTADGELSDLEVPVTPTAAELSSKSSSPTLVAWH